MRGQGAPTPERRRSALGARSGSIIDFVSSPHNDRTEASAATPAGQSPTPTPQSERTIAAHTQLGVYPTAGAFEPQLLAVGAKIGRYVALDRLGAGGMGIVYAAHDPELDRKIVLKLLHPGLASSSAAMSTGRARLLREAQAMARLSHANVVAIHDVGTFGDEVFIAMDFVDGVTLSQWLREVPRAVPELLRVFRDAGRGLAAAHRAGLVHRDFKPDNVMVATDGQVRVMDFGLARGAGADLVDGDAGRRDEAPAREVTVRSRVTAIGMIIGTPAYMAPEQFAQLPMDARTDQFSFCVALHEALYGERPFVGETVTELARSVTEGELRPPPRGSRVPPAIRRALLRGLKADPDARYPTMDALLDDLSIDTGRRRILIAIAAVAVAGLLAGLLLWRGADERAALCGGGPAQWSGVWDDARRATVRDGLLATGRSNAATVFERASAVLDAYTASWLAGHRDACEATHVRGEQSDESLDLRMRCLGRRREAARATVELLAAADVAVSDRTVDLVHALPPVAECGDLDVLADPTRPREDPAIVAEVDAIRARLSAAEANDDAGRFAAGLDITRAALAEAQALGHPPLVAEALLLTGRLQAHQGELQAAEATLLAAADAAAEGHDALVELAAWTELVRVVGAVAARPAEGLMLARIAAASLRRAGPTPVREAELATAQARVHEGQGKFAEARAELERALALQASQLAPGHPRIGRLHVALGDVAREQGDLDAARASYAEARKILVAALGGDHPDVAAVHNSTGNVNFRAGDFVAARAEYEAALAIREAVLGLDHPDVAATLNNMGGADEQLGELSRALELHERSLQIRRKVFGPRHPKVAMSLANIGNVLTGMDRLGDAIRSHREALSIREEVLGAEHPSTGESLGGLSSALLAEDRDLPAALEYALRSRVVFEQTLGPNHPNVASAHYNIASIRGRLGRHAEARDDLARAQAAIDAGGQPSPLRWPIQARQAFVTYAMGDRAAGLAALQRDLAACETSSERAACLASLNFALAKITWERGDQARGRALAEGAAPQIGWTERAELQRWLAAHPVRSPGR